MVAPERSTRARAMAAAFLALTLGAPALAQDIASQGTGTVQIGSETGEWWIPVDEEGYYVGVERRGSGVMGLLSFEAYQGPVGEEPVPPVLWLGIMAPELRPALAEVNLSEGPDGHMYAAEGGDVALTRDGDTVRIEFSAEATPLDPQTYDPVDGADPLPISGTFEVTAPE